MFGGLDAGQELAGPVVQACRQASSQSACRVIVDAGRSEDALLHAVQETSLVPARALGVRDLSPGSPADLVVLAPDLTPARVIIAGT